MYVLIRQKMVVVETMRSIRYAKLACSLSSFAVYFAIDVCQLLPILIDLIQTGLLLGCHPPRKRVQFPHLDRYGGDLGARASTHIFEKFDVHCCCFGNQFRVFSLCASFALYQQSTYTLTCHVSAESSHRVDKHPGQLFWRHRVREVLLY